MDFIDLYQIHRWDPNTPIEETLEALDSLVRAGKVRYLGASSMAAWQLSKALYTAKENGWHRFSSMQNHYNLIYREEEREMIPLCMDQGLGMIPWSPLARGFLTGTRRPDGGDTKRSEVDTFAKDMYYSPDDFAVADAVAAVAKQRGVHAGAGGVRVGAAGAGRHGADYRRDEDAATCGIDRGRRYQADCGRSRGAGEALPAAPGSGPCAAEREGDGRGTLAKSASIGSAGAAAPCHLSFSDASLNKWQTTHYFAHVCSNTCVPTRRLCRNTRPRNAIERLWRESKLYSRKGGATVLNALRNLSSAVLFAGAAITSLLQPAWAGSIYIQDNLASDGFVPAANIDANLKNPWGIAFSPTSPFWVSDQGIGVSTLYSGAGVPSSLVVTIPGGSTPPTGPTGTVFNSGPAGAFAITAPAGATVKPTFLFDTLAGTIDGWNPGSSAGSASAEVAATQPGAVYTGLALDSSGSNFYLYAANTAGAGGIDVYDTNFNNVSGTTFSGKFADPGAIAGYVPFNVQNIGGDLYVEYASLTPLGAPLPGGYVDVFDSSGNFLQRLATGGALEAPWGITLAPATGFGSFSGDLLVGNFGNGTINAFNPTTGAFRRGRSTIPAAIRS